MKKIVGLMFILIMFCCSNLLAGGVYSAKIVHVRVDKSGFGIVKFDKKITEPLEGVTHFEHLSFNTNEAGGRAIMSLVLAAQASGKKVHAFGTKSTNEYKTLVESWNWGCVLTE
ncbi:MAG: hypothetical protein GY714_31910 [Desulfobacterales bacterium]|nr:hypothetical protein [Desulfobacterales bacterium]